MVLGRSESARFRRAFDRADFSRDGQLTAADAARAYRELGGKPTEDEVCAKRSSLFFYRVQFCNDDFRLGLRRMCRKSEGNFDGIQRQWLRSAPTAPTHSQRSYFLVCAVPFNRPHLGKGARIPEGDRRGRWQPKPRSLSLGLPGLR